MIAFRTSFLCHLNVDPVNAAADCASAAAGNQLFNIVVDTDEIATKLTGIMNREKSGRATFMPLNRLNPEVARMPEDMRADARPLIEHIQFDPKFTKAMQQVLWRHELNCFW